MVGSAQPFIFYRQMNQKVPDGRVDINIGMTWCCICPIAAVLSLAIRGSRPSGSDGSQYYLATHFYCNSCLWHLMLYVALGSAAVIMFLCNGSSSFQAETNIFAEVSVNIALFHISSPNGWVKWFIQFIPTYTWGITYAHPINYGWLVGLHTVSFVSRSLPLPSPKAWSWRGPLSEQICLWQPVDTALIAVILIGSLIGS